MTAEAHKALARRLLEEGSNQGHEEIFLALLAPDVIDHYAPPGPPGREGWNLNRKQFRSAFPDGRWDAQALIAEGDLVVGRYMLRGTHQGEGLTLSMVAKPPPSCRSTPALATDGLSRRSGALQ